MKPLDALDEFDRPRLQRAGYVKFEAARRRAIDAAHRNGELAKERTTPSMPHFPCLDRPITNYLEE